MRENDGVEPLLQIEDSPRERVELRARHRFADLESVHTRRHFNDVVHIQKVRGASGSVNLTQCARATRPEGGYQEPGFSEARQRAIKPGSLPARSAARWRSRISPETRTSRTAISTRLRSNLLA